MKKRKTSKIILSFLFMIVLLASFMTIFQKEQTRIHAATSRYMGLNVGNTADWEGNLLFADAMKSARGFRNTDNSADVALDANGWPTVADFGIIVWAGLAKADGTYALSFEGQANVTLGWGGGTLSTINYNPATNQSTATLVYTNPAPDGGLRLVFTNAKRTTSSGSTVPGVVNIKLMRPITQGATNTHAPSETFSRAFKAVAGKFKVFRFMDFTATNAKLAEVNWSDRVKPTDVLQTSSETPGYGWEGKGGAWEYVILMCNELDADAWICIPASANHDYISKLANLFRYGSDGNLPYTSPQSNPVFPGLESGRKLYIEFSNELWNTAGGFRQSNWLREQAESEVAAGGSNLNYDGSTNVWQWAWRLQAKRTVEISDLFRQVWGDAQMMTTIRPVLEWQQGNGQDTARIMLSFIDNWYNNIDGNHVASPHPPNYYIYGGGGSAYYYPNNNSDSLTLDTIWNSESFNTTNFAALLKIDASFCAAFGLKRTAYEGGPSMDDFGHSETVKQQAWNDPRMKTLMIEHQTLWEQYEGDLLVYFTLGGGEGNGFYQWSFVNNIYNPVNTSPKLQAIESLSGGSPSATVLGTTAPATRNANTWDIDSRGWGAPSSSSITMTSSKDAYGNPPLNFASYNFRTTSTGNYCVMVSYVSSNHAVFDVVVDGQTVGTLAGYSGGATATYTSPARSLGIGLHGVKLVCKTGPVTINTIRLESASGSTAQPTIQPTTSPSVQPTTSPSIRPTTSPSVQPTASPSVRPTASPSVRPTASPSVRPTTSPSVQPTAQPLGNLALSGTPIASVMRPAGGGDHNINIIKDGLKPGTYGNSLQQYDTFLGNGSIHSEYIGYTFSENKTFGKLVFQEGIHFHDGGWFSSGTPKVQVRQNGSWNDVAASVSPVYPYSDSQGSFGLPFETYTFTFASVTGDGIRIIGLAGGSAHFISVAEIEVYQGSGGATLPIITPSFAPTTAKVDFESFRTGRLSGSLASSGFIFTNSSSGSFVIRGTKNQFASKVLYPTNWSDKITVTKSGGGSFNFVSFDYGGDPWNRLSDATITGYKAGGGTYTDTISSSSKTLSKKCLNWTNVIKVEINYHGGATRAYGATDNYVFN